MNIRYKRFSIILVALAASLFMYDAQAGKPVKVTVTAAVPDSAIQGDTEEVLIDGTGFDAGSTARFLVTGTQDDSQIDVNEVTFDPATGKLKAKIKVKDAALPVEYDIEVKTSSGRRGKGTTLFRVRAKDGQEDPCVAPETFAPDFAFLRDTGRTKGRSKTPTEVTIFLAESFTGCEVSLIEIPIVAPVDSLRNLKYSSVEDENGFFGRLVWTANDFSNAISLWKLDFHIVDADVIPDGEPIEVMRDSLLDHPTDFENITSLDLSQDALTLVYAYYLYYPTPENPDVKHGPSSLRIMKIDDCGGADTEPCGFGDLDHAHEIDSAFGTTSETVGFSYPSWGPLDQRIYVKKWFDDPRYYGLRYYDLEQGWKASWPPVVAHMDTVVTGIGRTDDLATDNGYFQRVSSGIMNGVEYLAIADQFSVETGGCEGIFIVEADDCLINGNCSTSPAFAGNYPSFTKDGILVHAYDGWEPHGGCHLRSVGKWDVSDGSLESLSDGGYYPDAAGGIPFE